MITPALPLAQPNDPSPQGGSILSDNPAVDFGMLLLSALAGPEPAADGEIDSPVGETVVADDAPPDVSGQTIPPPTIPLLNNPSLQLAPITRGDESVESAFS